MHICSEGAKLPNISKDKACEILKNLRPQVNDLFSITSQHYLNAGQEGLNHFHKMLNALIDDLNNISIENLNATFAIILYKGHDKDRSSDRSYRTISTCPLLAKALDTYVRGLNLESWNNDQAETQYQGEGMSHELAALLLTECIQHSLHSADQPMFALYLDAKSAFDVVLRQLLIKNLYFCGTSHPSITYINNRLQNRTTFIDWEKNIMGPIMDERGLEQGGVNSSDYYKIFGKEQLEAAQVSGLGVLMKDITISAIGDADDTVLLSNNIHDLNHLLELSLDFCSKYQVQLCAEKTKLQAFCTEGLTASTEYQMDISPVAIKGEQIHFTDTAEHVGIVRSVSGNLPNILGRFTAHKRALGAVLHTGMARGHRGNPAASMRIDQLHAVPVLLSGLGALVLKKSEIDLLDHHHKVHIENLLRLPKGTPRPVTAFLAGSLPAKALLHLRQLGLFGMISRLPHNILHKQAWNVLVTSKPSSRSWFIQIRDLCLMYGLPHPATILEHPSSKSTFKTMVKKKVISFWETKLRQEAEPLDSLTYFKPQFMSLTAPHPLWLTAGSSSYEVAKATVQANMLSGRYRTERLCRFWSQNRKGICLVPTCSDLERTEDLKHILAECKALEQTRLTLHMFNEKYCLNLPPEVSSLVSMYCTPSHPLFVHFLLDCSTLPLVIQTVQQQQGADVLFHLFHVTRTWCYSLHRERLKALGRWRKF